MLSHWNLTQLAIIITCTLHPSEHKYDVFYYNSTYNHGTTMGLCHRRLGLQLQYIVWYIIALMRFRYSVQLYHTDHKEVDKSAQNDEKKWARDIGNT